MLDDLGIVWDPLSERWEQAFRVARAYKDECGHLRVPVEHVVDGFRLGRWLAGQRGEQRAGRLSPGRERALDELGMIWNPPSGGSAVKARLALEGRADATAIDRANAAREDSTAEGATRD